MSGSTVGGLDVTCAKAHGRPRLLPPVLCVGRAWCLDPIDRPISIRATAAYKNEQPVIDSERQLPEKVVNEEVIVMKEYECRIAAINAVIAVCDAEEGAPSQPGALQKRSVDAVDTPPASSLPKRQKSTLLDESDDRFSQAIASVCVKSQEERPTICFICLGNAKLPESERLKMYKNPGSLS